MGPTFASVVAGFLVLSLVFWLPDGLLSQLAYPLRRRREAFSTAP